MRLQHNDHTFEFPTTTAVLDEPVMEGFETIADRAANVASVVMAEDYLTAIGSDFTFSFKDAA